MPNGARARPNLRPDHNGPQRAQFESNKKKIYATQKVCGICGKPVDFRLKWPQKNSCKCPVRRGVMRAALAVEIHNAPFREGACAPPLFFIIAI